MKLLKFCNLKNIYETRTAAILGIPLLGFHLISENDFKRQDSIKSCIRELRNFYPNTKSILVTKEKDINILTKLVKEFEFDGVQLHYPDSNQQAVTLKSSFGKQFIVIQVMTPENENFSPSQCDYLIIDKSYLGGTATQLSQDKLNQILKRAVDSKTKILLAGGISPANIFQFLDLPIDGFDVQSYLKSDNPNDFENIDYQKMKILSGLLGYLPTPPKLQVGFVVQDINQENSDLCRTAIKANVDFFHIDISDGFVGVKTGLPATQSLLNQIIKTNSHINLQLHFFVSSEEIFKSVFSNYLSPELLPNKTIFIHINRDNYSNFNHEFIHDKNIFFALDVKDIIDETFPWEQFIKTQLLICLQSTNHPDRVSNLNQGLKLIKYSTTINPVITIDRSIDYDVIQNLENLSNLNVVCGTYLREDINNRYQLIKNYFYAKKTQI